MFRQAITGLTVKTDNVQNVEVTIHKDDLLKAMAEIPTDERGCFVLVAEKRPDTSPKGHTHYKPCYVTAPLPR